MALVWRDRPAGAGLRTLALLAAVFACGTLIALPQIVEFLRILPLSLRGHMGYSARAVTTSSFDPWQAAEWLIPFVFGRPDLLTNGGFWGPQFFTGVPPYYLSLYPGLMALALVAASGRPRSRNAWWAWGGIGFGIFMSLGRFNPVAEWLFTLPGQKSLRYPVKFWLPVAVGAALLCAIGFERLQQGHRRGFRWVLLLLALAFAGFWAFLSLAPGAAEGWLDLFIARPAAFIANERLRWAGLCLFSLAILAALGIAFRVTRRDSLRSGAVGGALLVGLHAAAQLWLLSPLYPRDAVAPYLVPPPALAHVPADALVVNPDYNYLFGPSNLRKGKFPEPHTRWLERRSFYELYAFSSPVWRLHYELNTAPEGLDTFLARLAQIQVARAKNPERLRMLAAWGVSRLLVNHPLEPVPPHARLLTTVPSFGGSLYIYEVTERAPQVFLARRVFRERDLPAAYRRLATPEFDPRTDAVLSRPGPPMPSAGGTVRVLKRGPEEMEIETVAGPGGSLLVVQRSNLLFQATVDGRPAPVVTANLYRIGVQVPAGAHRVRLSVDRRPLHRSLWGALAGLLLLPALAIWGRKRGQTEQGQAERNSPEIVP